MCFCLGFSSGVMGAMTLCGNVAGAIIGFFFNVSTGVAEYDTSKYSAPSSQLGYCSVLFLNVEMKLKQKQDNLMKQ